MSYIQRYVFFTLTGALIFSGILWVLGATWREWNLVMIGLGWGSFLAGGAHVWYE